MREAQDHGARKSEDNRDGMDCLRRIGTSGLHQPDGDRAFREGPDDTLDPVAILAVGGEGVDKEGPEVGQSDEAHDEAEDGQAA